MTPEEVYKMYQEGALVAWDELSFGGLMHAVPDFDIQCIRFADAQPDPRTELTEKLKKALVEKRRNNA